MTDELKCYMGELFLLENNKMISVKFIPFSTIIDFKAYLNY